MKIQVLLVTFVICAGCYANDMILSLEFIGIPGGTFLMGCTCEEGSGCSCEYPRHEVSVGEFEMMTCEVSQAAWSEVTGYNPSMFTGDNLPVEGVSWSMCQEFINELNRIDQAYEYRLPTEAEWEYASLGGAETVFHWGDCCNDSLLDIYCWCGCNSGGHTHEVGSKAANQYGLYNMNGNVWEWCLDHYHESFIGAPCNGTAWINPEESRRIARGGCWFMDPEECRASFRIYAGEDFANQLFGLRLVRTLRDNFDTGIALNR